ncbi:MAG: hypothetical protein AAF700_06815 [Pseudomonadota bacterium]
MGAWRAACAGVILLAACEEVPAPDEEPKPPEYLGIETRKLDDELVSFLVQMSGVRATEDISAYTDCAAAQYALIRGYGFARHVRTNLDERAGLWAADAVYTISEARPDGLKTIDAALVVEDCAARGIPTV